MKLKASLLLTSSVVTLFTSGSRNAVTMLQFSIYINLLKIASINLTSLSKALSNTYSYDDKINCYDSTAMHIYTLIIFYTAIKL